MTYKKTSFKGTPITYKLVNDGTAAIAEFYYQGQVLRILPNYPGYGFARSGAVLSFKRRLPAYLKPGKSAAGCYWYVNIGTGDIAPSQLLHRLVALAFNPNENPKERTQVNHIDGNPANNAASNLEWVTPAENVRHANALRNAEGRVQKVLSRGQKLAIGTLYASGMNMNAIATLLKVPYESVRWHVAAARRAAVKTT